jgi:hypothetical protein
MGAERFARRLTSGPERAGEASMRVLCSPLSYLGLLLLALGLAPACDGGGSSSPDLAAIAIEAESSRIAVGETLQLTARGQYSDGASQIGRAHV